MKTRNGVMEWWSNGVMERPVATPPHPSPFPRNNQASRITDHATRSTLYAPRFTLHAFTLIELLVVIAIISLLAAMIFPITKAVNRRKMQSKARVELAMVEAAIKSYKDKLGQYPPDNPAYPGVNPLYYELLGTTNTGTYYVTLDGGSQIKPGTISVAFGGATGFANSTQPNGSDETRRAIQFLKELKPGNYGQLTNISGAPFNILTCSVAGPTPLNAFCYSSSNPTNNPNSYDLWVDIMIDGKTNRICNWSAKALTP